MRLHVLGSAAGGGFPQWNCNCPNCDGLRKGTIKARARTQSSITVTGDNENWVLFNASPDILTQFQRFPELQPARALRDTAVRAIVLIDGQIDHTTGLYMLREHRQPHEIWCTAPVRDDLTQGNPLFRLLGHYSGVNWNELPIDESAFEIAGCTGPALSRARPAQQCAAVFAPARQAGAGRQHRRHHRRHEDRSQGLLRPRSGRDRAARVGRHAGRRRRAGRWHLLERR
jgi:pyrroloquinoline quinone biosynthesis protein B